MATTVTTQAELDAALAANASVIYIESPADVWLTLHNSGSSRVVARDSSHVVAGNFVAVHLHSQQVTLEGGVVIDMTAVDQSDPATWCDLNGVKVVDGVASA